MTTLITLPPTHAPTAATPILNPAPPSLFTGYLAALLLILLSFLLGLSASTTTSSTFDEVAHLTGGYIHWTLGHPRIHTENGYLSQAIAAFPLLFVHPTLPSTDSIPFHQADIFTLGRDFLYHCNNNPAQLLLLGRAMIALLTALTSLTIYAWSRKLFSPLAGMLSLFVFAFSPIVLSHGYLATSDMPVTCFFLLSLASFWWALEKFSPLRIALSSLALGALFISKMSAPLILPALFILVLIRVLRTDPIQTRARKLLAGITLLLINALTVYAIIWATSGFTFSAFKDSPDAANETFWPTPGWEFVSAISSPAIHPILFARAHHLLPESYLYGYAFVLATTENARNSFGFVAGVSSREGHWWFYPYVLLITTPLPIFALIVLAVIPALRPKRATIIHILYTLSPLLIFPLFYIAAAILSHRGSEPRHLLPVYPMLCILLGAGIIIFKKNRLIPTLTLLSCLWLAAETLFIRPHFLSYFNELAGGPRNGYKHLVNSALDWGQNLPELADYIATKNTDHFPVYLAYFGSADPDYYGIHAAGLPSFLTRSSLDPNTDALPLQPGLYCISATLLQGTFYDYAGPYTPEYESEYQYMKRYLPSRKQLLADTARPKAERDQLFLMPSTLRKVEFARLCAYLRAHHAPDAQAGYSINLYWLTPQELDTALNGPPNYETPATRPH